MSNKELQKKVCRKCGGLGHFQTYEAPCVKRRYCGCETGKERKEFIISIAPTTSDPVWELFSL
tara:strand:- start:4166 stop:4354 length:189 start_codon:yes stop_codon:yes gene_type:complete